MILANLPNESGLSDCFMSLIITPFLTVSAARRFKVSVSHAHPAKNDTLVICFSSFPPFIQIFLFDKSFIKWPLLISTPVAPISLHFDPPLSCVLSPPPPYVLMTPFFEVFQGVFWMAETVSTKKHITTATSDRDCPRGINIPIVLKANRLGLYYVNWCAFLSVIK